MRDRLSPYSSSLPARCVVALALLLGGSAVGCEPRDSGVNAELQEAVELVQLASRGYIPAEHADDYDTVDVEAFRQATLADARPRLEQAMRAGTAEEQITARQMLADIHSSAARAKVRQANAGYGELASDAANLATKLRNVAKLDNRIALLQQDRSAVQRELNAERDLQQQRREELEAQRRELGEQIDALREARDEQRERADTLTAEANERREQAFTLEGEEYYDGLDEAAEVERRSSEADVEAERIEAELERRESERAALEHELEAIDAVLEDLAEQLEQWEQREGSRRERVEALEAEHREAAEALLERFAEVMRRHRDEVEGPFAAAAEHMVEAIAVLEPAADRAERDRSAALQRDLLIQHVAYVQVLVDRVMAAGSFGRTLAPLARRGPAVMPEGLDASPLEAAYRELIDRQEEVLLAGTGAAREGQGLASELGNVAGEDIQRFADRQRTNLARYLERFNDHALQ